MESGTDKLSSIITFSAKAAKEAEFPTDVVGIILPSSAIKQASNMAISIFGKLLALNKLAVSPKCWSIKNTSPLLIAFRIIGST
ncbi:hypothetical protein D3C85_1648710 [compost metagenome]